MTGAAGMPPAQEEAGGPPFGLIDARTHLPRPLGQPGRKDANLTKWFGNTAPRFFNGGSVDEMVVEMDACGIDRAVLVTAPGRDPAEGRGAGALAPSSGYPDDGFDQLCSEIAECVEKYPARFVGMAMLDPMGVMTAVRQAERAIDQFGFAGCAIMPSLIGVAPDDPVYFPLYAACEESGALLTLNMGIPGPVRRGTVQMPAALEAVALTFPALRLAATHVGHPWHDELLDLVVRLDNVYLMTSAWAPRHLPASVVRAIDGDGAGKIMWASDYPLLPFERCAREAMAIELADEHRYAWMRGTAERLFWRTGSGLGPVSTAGAAG